MNKKIIYIIACLLYSITSFSQISQQGFVREFNSGKTPIKGVAVHFLGSISTESDVEGRFILTLKTNEKTYGDPISFVEAKKAGYEVINETHLQSLRLSSNDTLATDIVLAKEGVIQDAKAEYAGVSLEALTRGYEREKATLLKQVNEAQIKEEEYMEQKRLLSEEYDKQQARLDALAQTFARVNFDDVSDEYKEALTLYKEGKLDEAIAKLESQNLPKQTQDIKYELKRISSAKAHVAEDERRVIKKKNQQIEVLTSLADMYIINFNPLKAEGTIETLLDMDSTDINILQKVADFYRDQYKFTIAKGLYLRIIKKLESISCNNYLQSLTYYEELGKAHHNLSQAYDCIGEFELAIGAKQKEVNTYSNAIENDFMNISLIGDQINAYLKLQTLSEFIGEIDLSVLYFDSLQICYNKLIEIDKSNQEFYELKHRISNSRRSSFRDSHISTIKYAIRKNFNYCGLYDNNYRLFRLYEKQLEFDYRRLPGLLEYIAEYALKSGRFVEAEKYSRRCIAEFDMEDNCISNLIISLLMQGKSIEARKEYHKYKNSYKAFPDRSAYIRLKNYLSYISNGSNNGVFENSGIHDFLDSLNQE